MINSVAEWNNFSYAYVGLTSKDKDGGSFTKSEAVSICKQLQAAILKGNSTAAARLSSGKGTLTFTGYLAGASVIAAANGGLMLQAKIVCKDIDMFTFSPSVLISNLSVEGKAKLCIDAAKVANRSGIDVISNHILAQLAGDTGGSVSARALKLIQLAKKWSDKYIAGKSPVDTAGYDYFCRFLENSNDTTELFNGEYTPDGAAENACVNSEIARILFDNSASLADVISNLCARFNLCYSPNIYGGLGKLVALDFSGAGSSAVPGMDLTRSLGLRATSNFNYRNPAGQVVVPIYIGATNTGNRSNANIYAAYPEENEGGGRVINYSGGLITKLAGIAAATSTIKDGVVSGRNAKVNNISKDFENKLKALVRAGKSVAKNIYYKEKYSTSSVNATVYMSDTGLTIGKNVSMSGIVGVLSRFEVKADAINGGTSATATLAGAH